MKESETALVFQILTYLGWVSKSFVWRQNTGAANYSYIDPYGKVKKRHVKFGFAGISDIIGCYKGRFLAIEVKVGKNKQTLSQKLFAESVILSGGIFILAYSLDDVINGLEKYRD